MKGAGIRRYNRPERDFLMIHRSFARLTTKELPVRGKVVGLYILSHDHGYVQTQENIAQRLEMAVRTVADALKDLERAGLLVRVEERNERGHRTGTAMHVSDVPFTDEERADLLGCLPAKSASAESAPAKSAGPKEINSKQESKREEDQPSGGAAGAAPADDPKSALEEPMPKTAPSAQAGLFDEPERVKDAKDRVPGAADVVAAYCRSFTTTHGRDPLKADRARVGRDAALILKGSEASVDELVMCAERMGLGTYANLGQELKMHRTGRAAGRGKIIPALRDDSKRWETLQQHTADRLRELEGDPLAVWPEDALA